MLATVRAHTPIQFYPKTIVLPHENMSNGKNVYANPARSTKFPFRSRSRVSRMTDSLLIKKEDRKYVVSVLGVHYCTHGARHFPPSPKLVVGHARSKSNFFVNVSKNDDMPRRRQRACAARRLPPVCLGCFLIMHRASSRFCKFFRQLFVGVSNVISTT